MRKTLLFAAATMLAVTSANAQQTVKIGLIMTYSGQFADGATQMDPLARSRRRPYCGHEESRS